MISREVLFCGQPVVLACDGQCHKAFGRDGRARVLLSDNEDDFALLADHEVGLAPRDPGTSEGADSKPTTEDERLNRWCSRACERSVMPRVGEPVVLRDFTRRRYNFHSHQREADAAAAAGTVA